MSKPNRAFNVVSLEHPMHDPITSEVVEISPKLAAEMLEKNHKNRVLRPRVVSQYARDMASSNWRMSAEAIKFDWNGRLIDGQHRLHAIIEADATVPMLVARNLDPAVQIVIDAGAKRTAGDALKFDGVGGNVAQVAAIARIAVAWDNGGMRSAAAGLSLRLTNSEVIDWVSENPEALTAAALASRHFTKIGMTPSALGFAAMKFLELDETDAIEFLSTTAEMNVDGMNDPRVVLIRTLLRLKQERVRLTPALQLSLIFRAWNAWRADRKVTTLPIRGAGKKSVATPEPK